MYQGLQFVVVVWTLYYRALVLFDHFFDLPQLTGNEQYRVHIFLKSSIPIFEDTCIDIAVLTFCKLSECCNSEGRVFTSSLKIASV